MLLLFLKLLIVHRDEVSLRDLRLSPSFPTFKEDEKNWCDWPLLTPALTPPAPKVFLPVIMYSVYPPHCAWLHLAVPCNTNTGDHEKMLDKLITP